MKKTTPRLEIDDLILKSRQLFLYEKCDEKSMQRLIKEFLILDKMNKKPITLWINSPGGSTSNGLALINIMRTLRSKVITIINTQACSMASQISIAGNKRYMMENGWWMAHDMSGGITGDYSEKVKCRAVFLEKHYQNLEDVYKKYTKLTSKDLDLARRGELWLNAKDCLKKGIVDKILY